MNEKQDERGRGGCVAFAIVAIILMLPLLYAASVGPAFWLFTHDLLPFSADQFNGFYGPLNSVRAYLTPLDHVLDWWVRKWVDVGPPSF